MATTTGALPSFPDDTAKQEYFEALNKTLKALETRAEAPVNLFNVAGQFFNPGRTGQFGEALGNVATTVGRDIEKAQEMAVPIAQMRAQIAGQKYTVQADDNAFRMLADNLGMSQGDLNQNIQSGSFSQPQLKRMMQLYPLIEKSSPTVGKIVNNMIDQAIKSGDLSIKEGEFRGKYDPNFSPFSGTSPTAAPAPVTITKPSVDTGATVSAPAVEKDVYRFENLSDSAKQKLNTYARENLGLQGDTFNRPDAAELFNKMPYEQRKNAFIKSGEAKSTETAPARQDVITTPTQAAPSAVSPRRPGETLDAYNARIKKESETELAVSQKSAEAREASPQKRFDVIASYDADTVGNTNNKLDYLYKQANTDMGKKVLSLMNQQNYMTAIGEAAEAGIQTPVGSLSLPYQDFIKKVKLNPTEQSYARLIDQTISELNQSVMKEGKAIFGPQISVYDAQKMAEPGFKKTDPPVVISALVNKFKIMNHFQGELNKAQQDYFERNPAAKTSQFFKSEEYKRVSKEYIETMKKLNQLSPF
jgi:hypothetical protein